jgi:hypothetical protein
LHFAVADILATFRRDSYFLIYMAGILRQTFIIFVVAGILKYTF